MTWPTTKNGDYLVLRTVSPDWTSRGGFKWRKRGETVAPDWDPDPARDCGGGLHGLLWGCGDAYLLGSVDDLWVVVAVKPEDLANPDAPAKVRFRAGRVRFYGARDEAVRYVIDHGGRGLPVVWARLTGGDGSTLTGGDRSTLTGGHGSTLTGGDRSTLTGGDWSTLAGGHGSTLTGRWWDGTRTRWAIGYVGEDGIEPDVAYRVNGEGTFEAAS